MSHTNSGSRCVPVAVIHVHAFVGDKDPAREVNRNRMLRNGVHFFCRGCIGLGGCASWRGTTESASPEICSQVMHRVVILTSLYYSVDAAEPIALFVVLMGYGLLQRLHMCVSIDMVVAGYLAYKTDGCNTGQLCLPGLGSSTTENPRAFVIDASSFDAASTMPSVSVTRKFKALICNSQADW